MLLAFEHECELAGLVLAVRGVTLLDLPVLFVGRVSLPRIPERRRGCIVVHLADVVRLILKLLDVHNFMAGHCLSRDMG